MTDDEGDFEAEEGPMKRRLTVFPGSTDERVSRSRVFECFEDLRLLDAD